MVGVCPRCSGINLVKLEEAAGKDNIEKYCIGECGGREDEVIGYVNGDFYTADSEEEFIKIVKDNM